MSDLFPFSDIDKLAEVKRELAQRRRVYPRLIEAGKMSPATADRQIAILESVQVDYEARVEGAKRT